MVRPAGKASRTGPEGPGGRGADREGRAGKLPSPAQELVVAERARIQNNLDNRLSELGRREDALGATQEAVQAYMALAFRADFTNGFARHRHQPSENGVTPESDQTLLDAVLALAEVDAKTTD